MELTTVAELLREMTRTQKESKHMSGTSPDFEHYPDLANRQLAGSVIWASDESFAERENLIMAHDPEFDPALFGNKGKVYDGWETRRRRHDEIGHNDAAIIRLGVPGYIRGVIVDTSWFTGNYPPQFAVKGICIDDYRPAEESLRCRTMNGSISSSPLMRRAIPSMPSVLIRVVQPVRPVLPT